MISLAALAPPVHSQTRAVIEPGLQYYGLSNGYQNWSGMHVTAQLINSPRDTWIGEAAFHSRFGDRGFFYRVANQRTLSRRWYGVASVATSSGGFYNPRLRVNAQVARKWLDDLRLVTAATIGYYDAKDVHRDRSLAIDGIYYFRSRPLVVQAGFHWTLSSPGKALSRYQYVAAIYGRSEESVVTARVAFGRESYQVVEPLLIFTDFASGEVSVSWRKWLLKDLGVNATASLYGNKFYSRTGLQVGVFVEF